MRGGGGGGRGDRSAGRRGAEEEELVRVRFRIVSVALAAKLDGQ